MARLFRLYKQKSHRGGAEDQTRSQQREVKQSNLFS